MRTKTVYLAMVMTLSMVAIGLQLLILPPDNTVAAQKTKILRLVVPSPPGEAGWPLTYMNDEIAKRFNARANGAYKIEVHAGGTLAKLPEYFDAVRVGAVEMACAPWTMFNFLEPRLGALELTFLFNNNNAANEGVKAALPFYDTILQEKFNAKGLGAMNLGGLEIFTVNRQIKTLEDWKGQLVASISPATSQMIKDLGGSATTIMWTDMYESLQKNIVEGATQGMHGALTMSFGDVTHYLTQFYGVTGMNGVTVNLDIWKKMPPDVQKALEEETMAGCQWMMDLLPELEAKDIAAFEKKGVRAYRLPADERDRWIAATAATREKQLKQLGEFGAQIVKIANEVNKKYPYTQTIE